MSSAGKSVSNVVNSTDSLNNAVAGLMGGYGFAQVATEAWGGATQAQFNKAYLATKMAKDQADRWIATIQNVVTMVPGDDTFMNELLTGAVSRQTNLTTAEVTSLGKAAADYMTVSSAMGKSMIETQMDLKEYVQTGNTSQLERDSILKNQMGTLENQKTVSDRILAINKALVDEGYAGLSGLDIASIKLETIKGLIEATLTKIGTMALPYIEAVLNGFLALDSATGGMSTTIMVAASAAALLGIALIGAIGLIVPIFTEGIGIITAFGASLLGVEAASIGLGTALLAIGSAIWPILAITAAVAAGIYIWQTYTQQINDFINAIKSGDWESAGELLSNSFDYVAENIWNALQTAGQYISQFLAQVPSLIGNGASWLVNAGNQIMQWILTGLMGLSEALSVQLLNMLSDSGNGTQEGGKKAGEKAGTGLIEGFGKWITDNSPKIQQYITLMFTKIYPLMGKIALQLMAILGKALLDGATSAFTALLTSITGWFVNLGIQAQAAGSNFVNTLVTWFTQLPGNIASFLWTVLNNVLYWNAYMVGYAIRTGINFITGLITYIQQLPGRVHTFLLQTLSRIIAFGVTAPARARTAGQNIVNGIISFVRNLPANLWTFLVSAAGRITSFGSTARGRAATAGQNIYNGIQNAITGIPGMVYNELLGIINQITSVGGAAYNTAVSLGQSIYNGLKAGLGINSPGYMYWTVFEELGRITNVMDENQSSFGAGGQGLGQAIANGFGLNLANLPDISGNISGIMGTSNTSNSSKNVVYVSLAGANLHNANDWTSKMEEIAQNVLDKNTPTSW